VNAFMNKCLQSDFTSKWSLKANSLGLAVDTDTNLGSSLGKKSD